jgi:hypothetical protein
LRARYARTCGVGSDSLRSRSGPSAQPRRRPARPLDKDSKVTKLQARGLRWRWSATGSTTLPRLARVDVGIAIRAGMDVAIESAGVVLASDDWAQLRSVGTTPLQEDGVAPDAVVARAALHSADRPRFEITAAPRRDTKVMVTVKMVGGPPGLDVEVQWISQSSWPTSDVSRETRLGVGEGLGTYQLFLNGEITLGVEVPDESEKGDVRVILACTEMGEGDIGALRRISDRQALTVTQTRARGSVEPRMRRLSRS